jgi:hypothetical protein
VVVVVVVVVSIVVSTVVSSDAAMVVSTASATLDSAEPDGVESIVHPASVTPRTTRKATPRREVISQA